MASFVLSLPVTYLYHSSIIPSISFLFNHSFSSISRQDSTKSLPSMAEHFEKSNSQSFALLNKYGNQRRRLRNVGEDMKIHACQDSTELSAVTIMRMAEIVLSQSTSLNKGHLSNILAKPYIFDSGLSTQSGLHLKHVLKLIHAAEKFSNQEYDEAEELLVSILLQGAHPIARIIYCYAQYLRERIDAKKCRIDIEREVQHVDFEEAMIYVRASILACEQKLPLIQISNFAAIHTILDSLESAEKIHFIDIGTKLCSHWIVMLQALSNRKNRQLKQLKIIEKLHFESEAGEKVAVFMDHSLNCLADSPKNVEGLIRGLKSLNPHVMVVIDLEENFSTSTFSERFRGALSHSSAELDCLESLGLISGGSTFPDSV